MSYPVGFSNNSAGPPPGDLHARSVTAAISRSGLTVSATRASSRRLSRSATKSFKSEYMELSLNGGHPIGNFVCKRERAAAVLNQFHVGGDERQHGDGVGNHQI